MGLACRSTRARAHVDRHFHSSDDGPDIATQWNAVQRDAEPFFSIADDLFVREFGRDSAKIASSFLVAVDTPINEVVGAASTWYGGNPDAE